MIEWYVQNNRTGVVTTTSAVSKEKAANNVRWTNQELFYKLSDYCVLPKVMVDMRRANKMPVHWGNGQL